MSAKAALRDELVAVLRASLEVAEQAQKTTREAATHPEAKPENDKDTRALEQSYLARGQALRVEELRAAVADVSAMPLREFGDNARIALGALVVAIENETQIVFFLAPHGGGTKLAGGVQVITPPSPLGRALLGKTTGDECEVALGKRRVLEIRHVE